MQEVKELEQFLIENNATKYNHEFALHHNRIKGKLHQKRVRQNLSEALKNMRKRDELTEVYHDKVKNGDFRPPTRIERLQKIANGHDDLECTKAAKRLLKKYKESKNEIS